MQVKVKAGVEGLFKLIARDENLEITRETPVFTNLVLDAGLDQMSAGPWLGKCVVGTGNSTPVANQVQLDNSLAVTTSIFAQYTLSQKTTLPYYQEFSITHRFNKGAAAGNLSEVAVGWGNLLVGEIFDRALIQDVNGTPTSITILDNEYLDVVFIMRYYYDVTNRTDTLYLVNQKDEPISTHTIESFIEFIHPLPNGSGMSNTPNISGNWGRVVVKNLGGNYLPGQFFNNHYANIVVFGSETVSVGTNTTLPGSSGSGMTISNTYPTTRSVLGEIGFGINNGNGEYHGSRVLTTFGYLKFKVTPKIPKNNTEVFKIRILITWDRYVAPVAP